MLLAGAPFWPALLVLTVWVVWMSQSGGYFARDWYPAAIVLTATGAVVALARRQLRPPAPGRAALALLAAFAAWAFVSLLWATSRGSALEAANQLLLYVAGAWVISLVPWRVRSVGGSLLIWSLTVGVVCAVALAGASTSTELGAYIVDARWSEPTRYANGAAALAAMAFWPAILLASHSRAPVVIRAAGLSLATFLIAFSLLPQSRGSLIATILVAPIVIALWPERFRLVIRLAIVAAVLVPAVGPIYDVFTAALLNRPVPPAIDRAATWILISSGLAAVAGAALALAERRVRPSQAALRTARRGAVALGLVAVVGCAAIAAANAGRIERSLSRQWDTFSSTELPRGTRGARITKVPSSTRYDLWRVALNSFAEAPLGGVGAGNFEAEYTEERRFEQPSRYAHSIWFRFLAEGGVIGAVLFLGFLAVLFGALVRAWRTAAADGRGIIAAATGVAVYFLLHASVDWLDVMPVLAAPALTFSFAALVATAGTARTSARGDRDARRAARAVPVLAAVAIAAVLVVLSAAYLAERFTDRAWHRARGTPAAALDDFDLAASLNPLSVRPHLGAGSVALEHGRDRAAARAFERALELEPHWYARFGLAVIEGRHSRWDRATRHIRAAERLNPREPLIADTRRRIVRRRQIDPAALARAIRNPALDSADPGH